MKIRVLQLLFFLVLPWLLLTWVETATDRQVEVAANGRLEYLQSQSGWVVPYRERTYMVYRG